MTSTDAMPLDTSAKLHRVSAGEPAAGPRLFSSVTWC
jgi:hypothetical protein